MTSSFGTVVGTPRDDLPDISKTNYEETDADLAKGMNAEIDRVTQDARQQSAYLQSILEAQEGPIDKLRDLANFSKSAAEFADIVEKTKEARRLNATAKEELSQAQKDLETYNKKDLLKQEAKIDGELMDDGSPEAIDLFLATTSVDAGEKANLRQLGNTQLPEILAGAHNWRHENNFGGTNTMLESLNIYNKSEDILSVSILYQYQKAGVNINSKAFEKEWRQHIYPEIKKAKDKALLFAENKINLNANKILGNKTISEIRDGLDNATDDKPFDTQELISNIKLRYNFPDTPEGDKDALVFLFKTVRKSIKDKDGKFFPSDLKYLEETALFYDKSKRNKVPFGDLNLGKNGELSKLISQENNEANVAFEPDPKELETTAIKSYLKTTFFPIQEEAIKNNNGLLTDKQKIDARIAWETNVDLGGRGLSFPEELLTAESQSYTNNIFGERQFNNYPKGVGQSRHPVIITALGNLETKYFKLLNDADAERNVTKTSDLTGTERDILNRMKDDLIQSLEEKRVLEAEFTNTTGDERVEQTIVNLTENNMYTAEDTGLQFVTEENFNEYANKVNTDRSILDKKEEIDLFEKAALGPGLLALKNNEELPNYWIRVADKLKMSPTALLMQRLIATGGYNKETEAFLLDKTYYKLTDDQREIISRNPSINTSIAIFYDKQTKGQVEDLMNGSRNTIMVDGKIEYVGDGYYLRRNGGRVITGSNGDSMSINALMNTRGISQIGRYGFSQQDLKDIKAYVLSKQTADGGRLLDFDSEFDENKQTQAAAILWKLRIEQKNGTRGFQIGDAQIGTHKMPNFSEDDIVLLNEIFPKLKDADFFAHWASHSDDLNNLFLSDKEVKQEAILERQNSIITTDMVAEFITNNRDNRNNKYKATVDGELVNFRKTDGTLIQDVKFTDLNEAAQKKLLDEQGLKFRTFGDSTEIIEKPKRTGRRKR